MSRPATVRKYGKPIKKSRAELLFAELPRSPLKRKEAEPATIEKEEQSKVIVESTVTEIAERLVTITLEAAPETAVVVVADEHAHAVSVSPARKTAPNPANLRTPVRKKKTSRKPALPASPPPPPSPSLPPVRPEQEQEQEQEQEPDQQQEQGKEQEDVRHVGIDATDLQVLTWDDVCPAGDRIEKIAEASYAEVYRITNERGTSIIKVIRLESPIRPQTKAQQRSGLVDEEPHAAGELRGELLISEWLADIPGFVVYKERYVVAGRAPKALLETHQAFHRRLKRNDPDRLQFYPSPSRYLDDTRFLVVELGDAGTALEDFELRSASQLWDIFLHTAIALARAEDLVSFEVSSLPRDLSALQVKPISNMPHCSTVTCTRATCASARPSQPSPRRTTAPASSATPGSRSPFSITACRAPRIRTRPAWSPTLPLILAPRRSHTTSRRT